MTELSPIYYRLYRSHRDNQPVAVCMQWFDEYDYDEDRFLSPTRYPTEQEAMDALTGRVIHVQPSTHGAYMWLCYCGTYCSGSARHPINTPADAERAGRAHALVEHPN